VVEGDPSTVVGMTGGGVDWRVMIWVVWRVTNWLALLAPRLVSTKE